LIVRPVRGKRVGRAASAAGAGENDGETAALLDDGVADLCQILEAMTVPRRAQDIFTVDAFGLHRPVEQLTVSHHHHRTTIHPTIDCRETRFDERQQHFHRAQRRNHDPGVDDGEVVAEQPLLSRFADDEQQDKSKVVISASRRRPVIRTTVSKNR